MLRTITSAGAVAGLLFSIPALAGPANAATHYTHGSTLTGDCAIHANYPKSGVPDRTWTKTKMSGTKENTVGVRYTYKGYAMVLDYAKSVDPSWGFIAQSCLTSPNALSHGDTGSPLGDLQAIGGDGAVKSVPISAEHSGKSDVATIHLTSNASIRSDAASFVIGNTIDGDEFHIPTAHCGAHSSTSWILGYSPAAGRWGYVEAMHLPACL